MTSGERCGQYLFLFCTYGRPAFARSAGGDGLSYLPDFHPRFWSCMGFALLLLADLSRFFVLMAVALSVVEVKEV